MSKMPAKKKSCFQITSVTSAQVAAIGAADDTESLDDPDESRTEDVSSEMYDMSRAEYEPACDGSSSEEAPNNVGEPAEAPSNVPHGSQSGLLSNPVGELRKVGVSGSSQGGQQPPGIGFTPGLPPITQPGGFTPGLPPITQPGGIQQPPPTASAGPSGVSVNTSQPAALTSPAPPPATTTVSCASRFRVIKLDHGTGEPFRRGRWMCTEFYEKDSEASVAGRTGDGIRHGSVTLDPVVDRDSGLGLTGGSVVSQATHSSMGLGSTVEASLPSTRMHSVETLPQQQQQILHQSYGAAAGSASHSPFSSINPPVPAQSTVGGPQPPAAQNMLPVGQNGLLQSGVQIQKSPVMPPLAQPVAYPPQQQVPMSHHLTGQTEYYQQQSTSIPAALATGQVKAVVSQPIAQGPTPVMPPASVPAPVPGQVGDVCSASVGQAAPAALLQQTVGLGGPGGSVLVGGSPLPQQTASQYAAAGHPGTSGLQNVPAIAASSSVPATVPPAVLSASSAVMPNVTNSSLPPGQTSHSKTPVALGMQGFPAVVFGQVEAGGAGVGWKSEGMVNAQSPIVPGREPTKPFMPETLQLTTPTVNSLFGIHIAVDGEEDSASGTNIVAIDNKIEQAMDLVKSHLMYAVREEVEVLKEQIKELYERNSVLERENAVLKSLANSEQLSQLPAQSPATSSTTPPQQGLSQPQQQPQLQPQQPQLQLQPKPQQLQTQPQLDPGQQLQPNVTSA